MPSAVAPLPWTTAISPFSSGANQREPDLPQRPAELLLARAERHRAPVRIGAVQVPPAGAVARVQQELSVGGPLDLGDRLLGPAGDSSGRSRNVPSPATSASISSVPSHGIRGWSQAIQAARRPSGESRGPVTNRCRSSVSSRTAPRSSAADPSSGTAAITRRTSVGAVAGELLQDAPHFAPLRGATAGRPSAVRRRRADSGVSGRGSPGPSGSYAYSRWSAKLTKTTSGPPSARPAPAQGRPPYSMTRLRTFHGAGSTDSSVPSARRRTRARRPALGGPRLGPPHLVADDADVLGAAVVRRRRARASIGDGQVP